MKTIKRNRISEKDTIIAVSFDKDDKIITSLYDSGFRSISGVISALGNKGAGYLRKIKYVTINNEDKGWYAWYLFSGKKYKG